MFQNTCVRDSRRAFPSHLAVMLVLLLGGMPSAARAKGSVECGLDCLFMAARFYRFDVELREIRNAAGPAQSEGYPLTQLRDVAKQFGLYARIYQGEPSSLMLIGSPCVVMLHLKSNHYVLMNDFDLEANIAHVFDPSQEKFEIIPLDDWSGFALLMAKEEIVIDTPGKAWKWRQGMVLAIGMVGIFLLGILGIRKWRQR